MLPDNFLDEDFPSASAYGEYLRERILKVAHDRGRWARLGELMGTPEEIMKKDAADWEGMLTFICGEMDSLVHLWEVNKAYEEGYKAGDKAYEIEQKAYEEETRGLDL